MSSAATRTMNDVSWAIMCWINCRKVDKHSYSDILVYILWQTSQAQKDTGIGQQP